MTQGRPEPPSRDAFRRHAFPPERRLVIDTLRLGQGKPMMHGFLELDVTLARRLARERAEREGEPLSFTAFMLACLGRAVAAHPQVHARRDWLGRLVVFEDVDAATIVEVDIDGRRFPLAHVVRAINRRSARDIHEEIRAVQRSGVRSVARGAQLGVRLALLIPGFLRRLALRALLRFPRFAKRRTGTLLVTAVGMFGGGAAGWGASAPGIHDLTIVIGGIRTRPAPDPTTGPRESLCLTVSANHALIDGAPLARFARELAALVARADGLAEEPITAPAPPAAGSA